VRQQNFTIRECYMNDKGLFEIKAWNMLDWAPMDNPDSGVVAHQNMWQVEALRKSARMAEVLGKSDDAKTYMQWAEELKNAINTHLWDNGKQAYIDSIHEDGVRSTTFSQQVQTVAYLCDIVPEDKKELVKKYITEVPEGWVTIGSPFMMAFTLEALGKAGTGEDVQNIMNLIRKWWGMMIDYDATACWETFGESWGGNWPTRSYCHAWSAAPAYALPVYVLGVQPIDPAFKTFKVEPYLGDLTYARGIMPTPGGEIDVNVEKKDGEVVLTVIVPKDTTALIKGKVYPAGKHVAKI
jgi:alpha-L-rhamnosidase